MLRRILKRGPENGAKCVRSCHCTQFLLAAIIHSVTPTGASETELDMSQPARTPATPLPNSTRLNGGFSFAISLGFLSRATKIASRHFTKSCEMKYLRGFFVQYGALAIFAQKRAVQPDTRGHDGPAMKETQPTLAGRT